MGGTPAPIPLTPEQRAAVAVGKVTESTRRQELESELAQNAAVLNMPKVSTNLQVSIFKALAGIENKAVNIEKNYAAEQTWLNRINNDPNNPQRQAEENWLNALPGPRREQMRNVLVSATPDERRRLLTLQGSFRQIEFNRLADLDEQARQSEQNLVSGGMTPQENNLAQALPADQRPNFQNMLTQLANTNPGRRAEMQAAVATMNDAERHAFTQMTEAERGRYLTRITDLSVSNFASREAEARGGLDPNEQSYILAIPDATQQANEATRLAGMNAQERGTYKATMATLSGAERAFVARLAQDQRQDVLDKISGMTAEQRNDELYILNIVNNHGFNAELADLVRDLPDDDRDQVLNWVNSMNTAQYNALNNLTATERLRILKITDQTARDRELNRIVGLGPAGVRAERGPEGQTQNEAAWVTHINRFVSQYESLEEQKRMAAMPQEQRAEFQAKLAQLNNNRELLWIIGSGSAQVEQRLDELLAMSPQERTQINSLTSENLVVWYSTLPESERAGAYSQLMNLNPGQLLQINSLSPAQVRFFTGLDPAQRGIEMQKYFAMSNELKAKDKLSKSMAELPQELRQNVHEKLNALYNYDNISIEARNAIVTKPAEWARLQKEFPGVDLSIFRAYLVDRSKTEKEIITGGANAFTSLSALINFEKTNGRISDSEHEVMRLKMEIYKELQNPSENIMERLIGPENMDSLRSLGLNIQQAWPMIFLALVVGGSFAAGGFVGGAFIGDVSFSWLAASGAGATALIVRTAPTYKNYQRAKTSRKLIELAQAERRVSFEKLDEYENKMLGGMEMLAKQIRAGVNPESLQDTDPELYNYLLGLGVIDQTGSVQAENIVQNLLEFGSQHASQVQELEKALTKRKKDIKSKKTKTDILGEATKSLDANVNIGGQVAPSFT